MHGVPKDLNLRRFHGATLTQVCLGEFQQQFHFVEPELHISLEGSWRVEDQTGKIIDQSLAHDQRDAYRVHRLLGRHVSASEIAPPESFTLRFDNGWALVVIDDSQEHESFSIHPGEVYV